MKSSSYDYLIIGGGLSGLTMAVELHKNNLLQGKQLLIIEKRDNYYHDKSWSSWLTKPHSFEGAITKSWNHWDVKCNNKHSLKTSTNYPYTYIPSEAFYQYCLKYIAKHHELSIITSCTLLNITSSFIETNQGCFSAKKIFDARPATYCKEDFLGKNDYLLQAFHGFFIKVDYDLFDPKRATLMDFSSDQSKGLNFMYLLPFSKTHALVEPTFFLTHQNFPNREQFLNLTKDYLEKNYHCSNFIIEKEESGILPMRVNSINHDHNDKSEGVEKVASNAGLLRPSSGYGFYNIQRYIKALVFDLKNNKISTHTTNKPIIKHRKISLFLDNILICACRLYPEQAAEIFYQVISKAPADCFVRFMQDQATLKDYFRIILASPKKTLTKTAFVMLINKLKEIK
jgi:lycopene beta-cyclase